MEKIVCKCKKSDVAFTVVGEDLWSATVRNCKIEEDMEAGETRYVCNECGSVVDQCDYYMMCRHQKIPKRHDYSGIES